MENFIVSARKYRPSAFDMVVGQSSITATLKNAIRNNTLAQAFLFCGPRGVGKTTCARIMAKTINCLHPTDDLEACNECESCTAFNNNASFNIYELDAASNNSVDDIRNLVEQVRIPPQIGKYKVYIIDEVHMLSAAAFNAFLKTLEEPPTYAKFILATTEKHKIIPTILSRCQIFDFKRITIDDIAKHLAYVASKEGVVTDPEALNIIAQKADGALRDALSIFDQMVSFSGKQIGYKDVIENLNVLDYDYYFNIVDYILRNDITSILLLLNDILSRGFEAQHFINGLGNHLRSLLISKDRATLGLMEVSDSLRQRYAQQSEQCSLPFLINALNINNQCDLDYRMSSNKRLLIELSLIKMSPSNGSNNVPADPQNTNTPPQNTTPRQTQPTSSTLPPTTHNSPIATQQQPTTNTTPQNPITTTTQITNTQSTTEEPQQPIIMNRPRRASTLSINSDPDKKKTDDIADVIRWDSPFTQEKLTEVWNKFADIYKDESARFSALLRNYHPELKDNFVINVKVSNELFESDTKGITRLREYLKEQLHNNIFTIQTEIAEIQREYVVQTDNEKFQIMAEKNPLLLVMQSELNLQINA